jgi:hypothetical protein
MVEFTLRTIILHSNLVVGTSLVAQEQPHLSKSLDSGRKEWWVFIYAFVGSLNASKPYGIR